MTIKKSKLNLKISLAIISVAILVEAIFLYSDIFVWMKMAWVKYPPDRFGPYVPIIFLCIFAYRIFKRSDIPFKSNPKGLTVVLMGVFIFLIGYAADIHIVQAASLIVTGFGITVYMMGSKWGSIMLFPFFFLILMLPTISFLLESTLGVFLRNCITIVSGTVLNLTGGEWKMARGLLSLQEIDLPIKYYRDSISSPLALLIQICIFAEVVFIKNKNKILFTVLCWFPLIIAAHSAFTSMMGWAFEHDHMNLSKLIWDSKEWLPALILMFMLFLIGIIVKLPGKKWNERKNEQK